MAGYPAHLACTRTLADGRKVLVRPIRAEDEAAEREFFGHVSDEAKRMRFMKYVHAVNEKLIHFFTHIDYTTHMAFVCEAPGGELVGEARYVAALGGRSCEFGVIIADAWHKSGIAGLLMDALIKSARAQKFEAMEGVVLRENRDIRRFARALGFVEEAAPDDPTTVRIVKRL
jgi:L-amino acid N-acyltransferase YncA